MNDTANVLERIAAARKRLLVVQEQLDIAQQKLRLTDQAQDVAFLRTELRLARLQLAGAVAAVDSYYQPALPTPSSESAPNDER